jgi:hypothetical protein
VSANRFQELAAGLAASAISLFLPTLKLNKGFADIIGNGINQAIFAANSRPSFAPSAEARLSHTETYHVESPH